MIIWMDYPYKVALENVRVLHVTEVQWQNVSNKN